MIRLRIPLETYPVGGSLIRHVRLIHELVHIQTEAVSSGFRLKVHLKDMPTKVGNPNH